MCVGALPMCVHPQRPDKGVGSPRTAVTDGVGCHVDAKNQT